MRLNLEDEQVIVLVMLDFTQAYDMIAHDLMSWKMRASQRNSDEATALLGLYLSARKQLVRSDDEYSTVRGIKYGVPHYKMVWQRIYSVLRSVKPHARYTAFESGRNWLGH
jgi:hypothetical protein